MIIEAFNREVYGDLILSEKNLAMLFAAWARLRHPRHWPRRLKTWFFQHQEEYDLLTKQY